MIFSDFGFAVASFTAVIYDWGEKIVFIEGIIDVPMVFSSTDIRTRGRLMLSLEQPSH